MPFWYFPQGMQLGFSGRIGILSGHLRTKINVRFYGRPEGIISGQLCFIGGFHE